MAGIKVYIADIKELKDDALYRRLYPLVSKERREKIDRMKVAEGKRASLGAELLLKIALSHAGVDYFEMQYDENGKPYIKDIKFNLSHSGERVMCVISEKEVGCDVEKIGTMDLKFAERFFDEKEYETICEKESCEEQKDIFYRLWTLKESFMKATGLGMNLPLNSFCFKLENEEISVCQNVNRENYCFKEYDLQDGYKYAVCGLVSDFEEVQFVILSSYY